MDYDHTFVRQRIGEAFAGHHMYYSLKGIVDYYTSLKPTLVANDDCLDHDIVLIRAIKRIMAQYEQSVGGETHDNSGT